MEKLPTPPYFSGPGHDEKRRDWVEKNLVGKVSDRTLANIRSEATIRWNRSGGSPSGPSHSELCRVIRLLNDGVDEEAIAWPMIDFNRAYIDSERKRLGLDRDRKPVKPTPKPNTEAKKVDDRPMPPPGTAAFTARMMADIDPAPGGDPDFWDNWKDEMKEREME